MYNDLIMEKFKNPQFVGEIENADGVGEVGNVKCGDIMRVSIKVKKEDSEGNLITDISEQLVEDIKFKTYGCVAAIASSEVLCEIAKGKKLGIASEIKSKDVLAEMGDDVPSSKIHCSILAHEALAAAIEDYNKKTKA